MKEINHILFNVIPTVPYEDFQVRNHAQFKLKLGISDTQRSASNMERGSQRPTPIKSIIDSYQGFISKMKFSANSL